MEAPGGPQPRTDSEPSIGFSGWVSVLTNTTPDIRSCRGVETAGAAARIVQSYPGRTPQVPMGRAREGNDRVPEACGGVGLSHSSGEAG
jgi:hypothetical protein